MKIYGVNGERVNGETYLGYHDWSVTSVIGGWKAKDLALVLSDHHRYSLLKLVSVDRYEFNEYAYYNVADECLAYARENFPEVMLGSKRTFLKLFGDVRERDERVIKAIDKIRKGEMLCFLLFGTGFSGCALCSSVVDYAGASREVMQAELDRIMWSR